jgi:hypothetical protein
MGTAAPSCSSRAGTDGQLAVLVKFVQHVTATLSSWAFATAVSKQVRLQITRSGDNRMDILGLMLALIQCAAMVLPYVGYHDDGGPVLFPPISCANHYSLPRRAATWVAFSVLAGGMHAWTCLTIPGNPMQGPDVIAEAFAYLPSAGLVLLAGNPVPQSDYKTNFIARGTDVEWLMPAAFRVASKSKKLTSRHGKLVVHWLMVAHMVGAYTLMVVPLVGALLRTQWYTKLCAYFALALFIPGCHRRLPIFHLAGGLLESKVMGTYAYPRQEQGRGGSSRKGPARRPVWTNELNAPRGGPERWKEYNRIGVLEHVLLNSLMLVIFSLQHHGEIHGPIGWATRIIALGVNVAFASFGGQWWLTKLFHSCNEAQQHGSGDKRLSGRSSPNSRPRQGRRATSSQRRSTSQTIVRLAGHARGPDRLAPT